MSDTTFDSIVDDLLKESTVIDSTATDEAKDTNDASTQGEQAPTATPQPRIEDAEEPAAPNTPASTDNTATASEPPRRAVIYPHTLPADKQGNLIDPATGAVVARAGVERTYYVAARNIGNQSQKIADELDRTKVQLDAMRAVAVAPEKLGLTPTQATAGLEWTAKYAKDPIGAAKELLADLAAKGHNLADLGLGLDTAALAKMMDERLKPFVADRQAVTERQQQEAQFVEEWNAIAEQRPWINTQDADIAKLVARGMDLHTAVRELEIFALHNGYDLNKLVSEQHMTARTAPTTTTQQPSQRVNRAMTPARTDAGDAVMTQGTTTSPITREPTSSRDLIRGILNEYGFKLNR